MSHHLAGGGFGLAKAEVLHMGGQAIDHLRAAGLGY